MNTANNILLAKWSEGDTSRSEIDQLSDIYDLNTLATDLDKLDEINLKSKNIEDAWLDFEQRLLTKKQKPSLVLR